ncbi:polyprenyl synthetase family protein [Streptomyces sp. NPDC093589]|uniref:polyprenyl synthetase family protein n=1 Tax=Streptomyces sp. NPDC093589 TaxID=3366043 RepID=UPI00382946D8
MTDAPLAGSSRPTPNPPPLPPAVHRTRKLVRATIEEALDRLHPDIARACRYYKGWCELDGTPNEAWGSRGLEASLVFLCAQAAGGDPEAAVPAAAALELMHEATMLHDDIVDEDALRRKRPTVWAALGTPTALLAGNALWAGANELLLAVPPPMGQQLARVCNEFIARILHGGASGQSLGHRAAHEISMEEYLAICRDNCALLGCAVELGVLMGGGTRKQAAPLREAAEQAGIGWQATNDLEDLWGDAALVGKAGYNDLRQRKKTLPILAALRSNTPAGKQLATFLSHETLTEDDLSTMAGLTAEAGGRSYAEEVARASLVRAQEALETAGVPEPTRTAIGAILRFVITR